MTSIVEPIRGKVARVLSDREVALNKGAADGVQIGMVFKILSSPGASITDPDTGEFIGSVELEKTSVKVTSVQERICVASTFRTRKVNVGGTGKRMPTIDLFEPPKWETRVESFKTDEPTVQDAGRENDMVKTGDPVVQDILFGEPGGSRQQTGSSTSPV